MQSLKNVFFGSSPLDPATPRTQSRYPGVLSVNMENHEEMRINGQTMSLPFMAPVTPNTRQLRDLPDGGRLDYLLEPGRASELLAELPGIFQGEPPVNCGAQPHLVGISSNFGEASYGREVFSPQAVGKILSLGTQFWPSGPDGNVQELEIFKGERFVVVGDTHGQLEDLLWVFFKHGNPSPNCRYLINGDIVDRGGHALEILLLLFCLRRDMPSAVAINRGNHEDIQTGIHFGFKAELEYKFGKHHGTLWNFCGTSVFPAMPLVHVILGPLTDRRKFCVMHGGVPVDCPGQTQPVSFKELRQIDRGVSTVQQITQDVRSHLLFNLLWADPTDSADGKLSGGHRGNRYTQSETQAFCDVNKVAFVVRSHEVPKSLRGAVASHGGKCFTIFSASNYLGSTGNRGGTFVCEEGKGLQLVEHWAPPWPQLFEILSKGANKSVEDRSEAVGDWEQQVGIKKKKPEAASSTESPRAAQPLPQVASSNSEAQLQQFVIERICEDKDELYNKFSAQDDKGARLLPKSVWASILMSSSLDKVLTRDVLDKLAGHWKVDDPVNYIRFLHRFQIRGAEDLGNVSDLMREVSKLRKKLIDSPVQSLERLLDPSGDRKVSCTEFAELLPQFSIQIPQAQVMHIYESLASLMQQNPLTLDSTILCLSIMSRDPAPVNQWSEVAENIGVEISKSGKSYAYAFRLWDTDRDGFLQQDELKQGLERLFDKEHISSEDVADFMQYVDGLGGSPDGRVSLLEFVRAVAPRSLSATLHKTMLKEVLRRVWVCRPLLEACLLQFDKAAIGQVTREEFRTCILQVDRKLREMGRPALQSSEVEAICEIASGGARRNVNYKKFIKSLRIVDTETHREAL